MILEALSPAGVRQPRQRRSEATLARILGAARSLLDEKLFEDVPISEIMQRAGMSVGTFYTRFRNKQDLLPYLYEQYDLELDAYVRSELVPGAWSALSLTQRVQRLVHLCVSLYRANRGLWRAMLIHACTHPEAITPAHQARRRGMVERIKAILLEKRAEISHGDPEAAVEFVLVLLFSSCKSQILLAEGTHGTEPTVDSDLERELTRAVMGYLGLPP